MSSRLNGAVNAFPRGVFTLFLERRFFVASLLPTIRFASRAESWSSRLSLNETSVPSKLRRNPRSRSSRRLIPRRHASSAISAHPFPVTGKKSVSGDFHRDATDASFHPTLKLSLLRHDRSARCGRLCQVARSTVLPDQRPARAPVGSAQISIELQPLRDHLLLLLPMDVVDDD